MKYTAKEILSITVIIVFCLMAMAVSVCAAVKARESIEKARQPKVYQIDTTKVTVLYENTWGKIILVKEEDL